MGLSGFAVSPHTLYSKSKNPASRPLLGLLEAGFFIRYYP